MRRTVILAAAALACMLGGAAAFSLADHVPFWLACYWSVETGTTTGYGDIAPRSGSAHVIAIAVMLTAIPFLGATFASLTAMHVRKHVRAHVDRALDARSQPEQPAEGEQQ